MLERAGAFGAVDEWRARATMGVLPRIKSVSKVAIAVYGRRGEQVPVLGRGRSLRLNDDIAARGVQRCPFDPPPRLESRLRLIPVLGYFRNPF